MMVIGKKKSGLLVGLHALACVLALASSACVAPQSGAGRPEGDELAADEGAAGLGTDGEGAREDALVSVPQKPEPMGQERFGGHPEPWTPLPGPGPRPER